MANGHSHRPVCHGLWRTTCTSHTANEVISRCEGLSSLTSVRRTGCQGG